MISEFGKISPHRVHNHPANATLQPRFSKIGIRQVRVMAAIMTLMHINVIRVFRQEF